MTADPAAGIRSLIAETEGWLHDHRSRRDRHGMSKHDRAGESIEALACFIRLRALRDALRTIEGSPA